MNNDNKQLQQILSDPTLPVPAFFDDSLSLYEQLCMMYKIILNMQDSTGELLEHISIKDNSVYIDDLKVENIDFINGLSFDELELNKLTCNNIIGKLNGSVTGSLAGNASTATKLQTKKTISLTGDVVGSAQFDGSSDLNISTTIEGVTVNDIREINNDLTINGALSVRDGINGTCTNATNAVNATNAENAIHATKADTATKASSADTATKATTADSATTATSADIAKSATTATNATNATYATKIGKSTATAVCGATNKGVYVNSSGSIVACSATKGSTMKPTYLSSGSVTECGFEVVMQTSDISVGSSLTTGKIVFVYEG